MHRPDSRHTSNAPGNSRARPAPAARVSLTLALLPPALVAAAAHPGSAAVVSAATLGVLTLRR